MDRAELAYSIQDYLPDFLSRRSYEEVIGQLNNISGLTDYYWHGENADAYFMLQGDAWTGVPIVNQDSGERKTVTAVVVSNSCDIDPNNVGRPDKHVVVSPLINLIDYENLLQKNGINGNKKDNIIKNIRTQRKSEIIWFPPDEMNRKNERILLLDRMYGVPLATFQSSIKNRAFRLSNAGFYVFLLKISIHFTRLLEKVDRSELA